MAKLCYKCDGFYVIFLIFSSISTVITTKDFFLYHINDNLKLDNHGSLGNDFIEFKLLHNIQKRTLGKSEIKLQDNVPDNRSNVQISNSSNNAINTPNSLNITLNTLKNNTVNEKIDNKKPLPPPVVLPKFNETASKSLNDSSQKILAEKVGSKNLTGSTISNLGENGTGLQWPNATNRNKKNKTAEVGGFIFPEDMDKDFFNKHNISFPKYDNHVYYNSVLTINENVAKQLWVNMSSEDNVKVHEILPDSYRRAMTIRLSFDFPYYGDLIRNITVASGGFLYTGLDVHSWLAATQYIAPLMANFDTSLGNDSHVKYLDNGTALTVEWENVRLQDNKQVGKFTFQTTLLDNGDIIFVYKFLPILVENIQDTKHPVKIGISDAYVDEKKEIIVRRKTIYEYHKVDFKKEDIKNGTFIHLIALPTCTSSKNCTSCFSEKLKKFQCSWCPMMNKCSNGYDRSRSTWYSLGCNVSLINDESRCPVDLFHPIPHDRKVPTQHLSRNAIDPASMGLSGIMTVIIVLVLVSGLAIWVIYAYRNPHSFSGQMLIRYRPSQWRWKRGEARYTAATIHM